MSERKTGATWPWVIRYHSGVQGHLGYYGGEPGVRIQQAKSWGPCADIGDAFLMRRKSLAGLIRHELLVRFPELRGKLKIEQYRLPHDERGVINSPPLVG